MTEYIVQDTDISIEDIRQAVAIHRRQIRQGFLSSLGDRALQLIFSMAANSRSGVLLIAKVNPEGQVCGFLLGALNTGAFYREFLVRKGLPAIITTLPKLLSLGKIRKVLETLLYPSRRDTLTLPEVELLDIAISEKHQGTGLAQMMFHEFSALLQNKRIRQFKITTGETLVRAHRFYENLGAARAAIIEIHKGQKTVVYTYTIPGKTS
jgi:ribosomal protein S18 acetylase RimI-like enzyme